MAWSATARGSAASTTAASSYATGSYTPTADRLLIAFVNNVGPASPATADDQPAASGNGATWHLADEDLAGAGVSSMFVALSGASPTTTAFTATFGQNQTGCALSVFEVEVEGGVPATALGAIVQTTSVESSSAATSGSLALPVAPAATSSCVAAYVHNANEVTTPRVNWAEIHDVGYSSPNRRLQTQFRPATAEQTSSASWSSSVFWRAIMAEIAETSVGGVDATVTPAVIAATASLPAMSASAGSTVSPASVSLVAGLPSASLSAGSTVSPAAIAATTGIPAAALSAGATLAPGSIAVVVSLPEVTIESGSPATVTPATISLVTTLPAASITADSTVAPSPIALIVSFPAPRIVIPIFRYLFTPPTHEVVAWETGRDDKGRRADQTWRHYDRGDRGKTVVRTNGQYATYTNPLYTVLENADDIRLIDGTVGKAVFLGGHITEVTTAIKDDLEAAGFSVEQEEVPQ